MSHDPRNCPDCGDSAASIQRREFLKTAGMAGAAALGMGTLPLWTPGRILAADKPTGSPESLVKVLYDALSPKQRGFKIGWELRPGLSTVVLPTASSVSQ